ncbi:hypothetical protein BHM03_00005782 [Ensete ventricosum]|uniref:Uncharacterized protein n=1 Tax=Ensete ventricosum TaxID=4639 RepID=A0A445MBB1_ENSVE|nr:hypothetical protein BHM03_00005782 [Ensete ventricosum]
MAVFRGCVQLNFTVFYNQIGNTIHCSCKLCCSSATHKWLVSARHLPFNDRYLADTKGFTFSSPTGPLSGDSPDPWG